MGEGADGGWRWARGGGKPVVRFSALVARAILWRVAMGSR
jgi:hypothetical protein